MTYRNNQSQNFIWKIWTYTKSAKKIEKYLLKTLPHFLMAYFQKRIYFHENDLIFLGIYFEICKKYQIFASKIKSSNKKYSFYYYEKKHYSSIIFGSLHFSKRTGQHISISWQTFIQWVH